MLVPLRVEQRCKPQLVMEQVSSGAVADFAGTERTKSVNQAQRCLQAAHWFWFQGYRNVRDGSTLLSVKRGRWSPAVVSVPASQYQFAAVQRVSGTGAVNTVLN